MSAGSTTRGQEAAVTREVNRVLRDLLPDVATVRAISFDSVLEAPASPVASWRRAVHRSRSASPRGRGCRDLPAAPPRVGAGGMAYASRSGAAPTCSISARDGFVVVAAGIAIGIVGVDRRPSVASLPLRRADASVLISASASSSPSSARRGASSRDGTPPGRPATALRAEGRSLLGYRRRTPSPLSRFLDGGSAMRFHTYGKYSPELADVQSIWAGCLTSSLLRCSPALP